MRFLPKWIRRLLVIVGLLVAAVVVLYFFTLPPYVRSRIRSGLHDMGVNDSAFELRSVTLGGLDLHNIDLGQPHWLSIARIQATYSLATLVNGRIKKVEVDDAQWRIAIKDGRIELGPTFPPSPASTQPMDAAFDQLVLRRATLIIDEDGQIWPVPVDGTLTRSAPGKIAIALTLSPLSDAAQLNGMLTESSGVLSLDGSWQVQGAVPTEVSQMLQRQGVALNQRGLVALSGQMKATLGPKPERVWRIDVPAAHAAIASSDLNLSNQGLSLKGMTADLNLRAFIDHQGASIFSQDGGNASIEQLEAGSGRSAVQSASPIQLAFDSSISQPLARIDFGGDSTLNVSARSTKNVTIHGSDFEATSNSLEIKAAIGLRRGEPASTEAQLDFGDAIMTAAKAGVALKGISGSIPIAINHDSTTLGKFVIDSIVWQDAALPGMAGSISVRNQRINASANWPILQNANMAATAWLDLAGQSSHGELTTTVPQFEMAGADELAKLFPALGQTQIGGAYSLSAQLQVENGQFHPLVQVTVEKANIDNPNWSAGVQSASGTITINNFAPLSTLPDQRITIGKARLGKLDIDGGSVALTIEKPDSILIQQATWSMGDYGQFQSGAFRFDPQHPRMSMHLSCEDVGLGPWLELLTSGKIKGAGRLDGQLAITYVPEARKKILIGEGSVQAQAAGGWVQTNDTEGLAAQLFQSNPALETDERLAQLKQRILGAFMNFQYSHFQVDFVPQPAEGTTTCSITTRGFARGESNPLEIGGLTIDIHQFDDHLNQVVLGLSAVNRIRE